MFCSRCGTEVDNQARFCPSCGLDLATTTPLAAVQPERDAENELDAVRDALKEEWEIEKELGRGGMAIVFRAHDKHLHRDVAIKVLPFSLAFDAEFVERFQREARTAAQLEHPHIIPIYRVGKTGRVIYFVMKYLRGGALSELLAERGRLTPNQIRQVLVQTGGALGYANQHGIVHRDIKPDNIMFDELGQAVLTDFGIAKAATGSRLTGTGMSIGTPHYMSPEQARAQSLDGRSDIYSLGVVAYQCLTGTVPFDGEDAFSIGYKHIMEEVPAPELHTNEERSLMGVIRRMMAKQADERFQNAGELIAGLEGRFRTPARPTPATTSAEAPTSVMESKPTTSKAIPPDARPSTPTTPIPAAQFDPAKEKKRSGVLVGMVTVLLLGLGGASGYWYFGMDAAWPPFPAAGGGVVPAESTAVAVDDSLGAGAGDSLALAAGDSGAAPLGSGVTDDTSASVPVAELPPTGVLHLTGVPSFARVTVDGAVQTGEFITVGPGSKRIQVTKTGQDTFTTTVSVRRGDTTKVAVRLNPLVAVADTPTTRRPRPRPLEYYCADPVTAGDDYNAGNRCFDTGPRPLAAGLVPVRPEIAQQQPTPVRLWVKVHADGSVGEIKWVRQSNVRAFSTSAARFALYQMTYSPAQKGGQAVDGWVRMALRARPE
jgi:serine/threonine-protein kinase